MESQPNEPQAIRCPSCGYLNPPGAAECANCHASLVAGLPSSRFVPERPGCVSAYAVLLGVAAVLTGIGGLIVLLAGMAFGETIKGSGFALVIILILYLVIAVLYFLLARGLWQMKNWARVVVIVLHSLAILASVCSISALPGSETSQGSTLVGTVAGLIISGIIIYWFATHRQQFH